MIWITGLSGAGKSSVGRGVADRLRTTGACVIFLDGDELRDALGPAARTEISYTRDGRVQLAHLYGRLCQMLAAQGMTVVIATISMFNEVYSWNRNNLPGYFEVHVRATEAVRHGRDSKGVYSGRAGTAGTPGAGVDYDEPGSAHCTLDNNGEASVSQLAGLVISAFETTAETM